MRFRQAVAYAAQANRLPQVKVSVWCVAEDGAEGGYAVRVVDHYGTVSEVSHDCEIRSLLAIWRAQAIEAIKAGK